MDNAEKEIEKTGTTTDPVKTEPGTEKEEKSGAFEEENNFFARLKKFFTEDTQQEEPKKEEPKKEEPKKESLSPEEIEKLIDEKAQEKVNSLAKTTKEKAKEKAELEKKLTDIKPEYQEFIAFKMKDKEFNLEEFLKNNKQYLSPKSTHYVVQNNKVETGVKLTAKQKELLKLVKE